MTATTTKFRKGDTLRDTDTGRRLIFIRAYAATRQRAARFTVYLPGKTPDDYFTISPDRLVRERDLTYEQIVALDEKHVAWLVESKRREEEAAREREQRKLDAVAERERDEATWAKCELRLAREYGYDDRTQYSTRVELLGPERTSRHGEKYRESTYAEIDIKASVHEWSDFPIGYIKRTVSVPSSGPMSLGEARAFAAMLLDAIGRAERFEFPAPVA